MNFKEPKKLMYFETTLALHKYPFRHVVTSVTKHMSQIRQFFPFAFVVSKPKNYFVTKEFLIFYLFDLDYD
jgi:hypothetical protein